MHRIQHALNRTRVRCHRYNGLLRFRLAGFSRLRHCLTVFLFTLFCQVFLQLGQFQIPETDNFLGRGNLLLQHRQPRIELVIFRLQPINFFLAHCETIFQLIQSAIALSILTTGCLRIHFLVILLINTDNPKLTLGGASGIA